METKIEDATPILGPLYPRLAASLASVEVVREFQKEFAALIEKYGMEFSVEHGYYPGELEGVYVTIKADPDKYVAQVYP